MGNKSQRANPGKSLIDIEALNVVVPLRTLDLLARREKTFRPLEHLLVGLHPCLNRLGDLLDVSLETLTSPAVQLGE